jgi:hypothetical protein
LTTGSHGSRNGFLTPDFLFQPSPALYIIEGKFPTVVAFRDTLAAPARGYFLLVVAKKIIPRVRRETAVPPVFREEHIGKEAPAGKVPPTCPFELPVNPM